MIENKWSLGSSSSMLKIIASLSTASTSHNQVVFSPLIRENSPELHFMWNMGAISNTLAKQGRPMRSLSFRESRESVGSLESKFSFEMSPTTNSP